MTITVSKPLNKGILLLWTILMCNTMFAQSGLWKHLDTTVSKDTSRTINRRITKKQENTTVKQNMTTSDSLKKNALKKFEAEKLKNGDPFACVYLLKLDKVGDNPSFNNSMQQGFPFHLSVHFTQDFIFLAAEADVLYYFGWALAKYPNDIQSNRFNLSGQLITGSLGGMFYLDKLERKKIGPGFFWGGFQHNLGVVQMVFGSAFCYQYATRNHLPVKFQARLGGGVVDVSEKSTKIKGTYWEFSSQIPISFANRRPDACLYISPYALYCKVPYYEDYKYIYTPSSFMLGLKLGFGIVAY